MKKLIFTLMIMAGLAMVANTAWGQGNTTPFPGGTYSYILNDIGLVGNATAEIEFTGGNSEKVNVNSTGSASASVNLTSASENLTFTVAYSMDADDEVTNDKIRVTITYVEASGCYNFIELAINVQPIPTLELSLAISPDDDFCQELNNNPDDNTAADIDADENKITVTVTPDINIASGYTFSYVLEMSNLTSLTDYSIEYLQDGTNGSFISSTGALTGATAESPMVFEITFATTTGIAQQDFSGQITGTPSMVVTSGTGTITYDGDVLGTNPVGVNVKAVPAIGSFTTN